jgi:polyhydroxybutyrate depolymerase
VGILKALTTKAKAQYNVDPKRIFFLGHSNGAFMAHRMACEASDSVAAVVAISGDVWLDPAVCQPTAPVAVLQVHGDADAVVPYEGTGSWPSAQESIATWATLNNCTGILTDTGSRLDLVITPSGAETKVERYACATGAAELWTMQGCGHEPDFSEPDATLRFIDWLLAHPKP